MNNIEISVKIFIDGGIVIFPTDTVFGVGCRIDNPDSVKRLFSIRRRPKTKATPVLVSSIEMAKEWVDEVSPEVLDLMNQYWPGGLTIILKSTRTDISPLVMGNSNTLGVRMPDHKALLSVIDAVGVPILGPSANFSGEKTPFKKEDLDQTLVSKVDCVMEGESKGVVSSTVIDCTKKPWKIIRQGAVSIDIRN